MRLPRQRRGIAPQMHGRYPDYDVLEQAPHWDPVTRRLILDRVHRVPALAFFTAREARCLRAFLDLVLAQDADPRIPVLELVDERLAAGQHDGYRYADMPDDGGAWRQLAAGLDACAAGAFADLPAARQRTFADRLSRGQPPADAWGGPDPARTWSVVMRYALSAFYSHPWAWNEIGFSGPAYPRGAMRLGAGRRGDDPTDAREAIDVDPVRDAGTPAQADPS